MLWPTTASGTTPQARQRSASATCSANIAGCATAVSPIRVLDCGGQRPTGEALEQPVAGLDGGTKHGVGGEQAAAHRPPLRALAGEDEGQLPGRRRAPGDAAGDPLAARESQQLARQLAARSGDHRQPVIEMGAAMRQGRGDGGKRFAALLEMLADPAGLRRQRRRAGGRERHNQPPRCRSGLRLLVRPRLEQGAGIGAAEAEGVDRGDAPAAAVRPGLQPGRDGDAERVEGNVGIGRDEMQVGRDGAVAQAEHRLDHAGDAGRRFEMADIGLDRAHQAARSVAPGAAEHGADRTGLDRVADRRSGAVRLDIADDRRIDRGAAAGLAQHRLLRRLARHPPVPTAPQESDVQEYSVI